MKVLAWTIEQSLMCSDCRTRLDEWDPKKGGHRQAYATATYMCPGCQQAETVMEGIAKEGQSKGVKVRLERTRYHPLFVPKPKLGDFSR